MAEHAGQPTRYKPEFCQAVIEEGRQGKSLTSMALACGVCKDTLYEWCKVHPEFSESLKEAKHLSQKWWEDIGQKHIVESYQGDKINAALYAKNMACRFPEDWTDRSVVANDPLNPFQPVINVNLSK